MESKSIDQLFAELDLIAKKYNEGIIDKTDALRAMSILTHSEVLSNAEDMRNKAEDMRKKADVTNKIAEKIIVGTTVKLHWSSELDKFVTLPED